jgi:hypothetical protein
MTKYEITVYTDFGNVYLIVHADNYESAEAYAYQMNQGHVYIDEIEV